MRLALIDCVSSCRSPVRREAPAADGSRNISVFHALAVCKRSVDENALIVLEMPRP
jgi:hypothetical protein